MAGRHALALLADEAGLALPLTQWPLPAAAVAHALDALPAALPPALDEARSQVRRQLHADAGSRLTITARGTDEALSGFGDDGTTGSSLALHGATFAGPHTAVRLGGRVEQDIRDGSTFRLEGAATDGMRTQARAGATLRVPFDWWPRPFGPTIALLSLSAFRCNLILPTRPPTRPPPPLPQPLPPRPPTAPSS